MQESTESPSPLPYADIAGSLLGVIYDSLQIIYESRFSGTSPEEMIPLLVARAKKLNSEPWAKPPKARNPHVMDGIPRKATPLYDTGLPVPRITRLCLEAVDSARRSTRDSEDDAVKGIFVPSPLAILVDVLTTPWRPESSSYGFALARAILFTHFRIHPSAMILPTGWRKLSIAEVKDAMETFRIYAKHRDNIHHPKSNVARAFLAHFLAMKGILVLRFGTSGKTTLDTTKAQEGCLEFLAKRQFLTSEPNGEARYEFRLAPSLEDIPDTQEVLNSLMGVPVPIAGGATVFFGGFQRSHHDSVVMSVSGPPGSGKTSFALALAASLAPFGTRCLYCTFEEDAETLTRRALGLVPQYFRRTTLPNAEGTAWLFPVTLEPTVVRNVENFSSQYLSILKDRLLPASSARALDSDELPALAPLLIVIDSLTTLLGRSTDGQLSDFCAFVRRLRELQCIVLLLSADDIPKDSRLEYLVDTVISLRHEGTDRADQKPFRLFQLFKTRLQMSRPGSHLLHLSGERGVRLSPQLPSQLDSHKIHRNPLPDRSGVIDTLMVDKEDQSVHPPRKRDRLVDLFPSSKILIHGHGSSGKAALALKILTAPTVSSTTGATLPASAYKRPRILVVSFLYPEEYYHITLKKVSRLVSRVHGADGIPEMRVLALTPSYIGPEDYIGRVLLEMDRGYLEGWPYTGVLLDGLHNTFLQFPLLQGSHMVWPGLYSLLSRYDLTIVTTFTTFAKTHPTGAGHNKDDEELILKGQLPFLHVLVQGTDFLIQVEPRDIANHDRTFQITVGSALGQHLPRRALVWNADDCTLDGFESLTTTQLQLPLTSNRT